MRDNQLNDFQRKVASQVSLIQSKSTNILSLQNIADDELQYITSQPIQKIQSLKLNSNRVTSLGVYLLSAASWTNLTIIQLGHNQIGDLGCKYLTRAIWHNLHHLLLSDNSIGEAGICHLSKGRWRQLNTLPLSHNEISIGLRLILKGNWNNLMQIYLTNALIDLTELKKVLLSNWELLATLRIKYNVQNDEQRNVMLSWAYSRFKRLTQLIIW